MHLTQMPLRDRSMSRHFKKTHKRALLKIRNIQNLVVRYLAMRYLAIFDIGIIM